MWAEEAEAECTGPLKGARWECDIASHFLSRIYCHTHTHSHHPPPVIPRYTLTLVQAVPFDSRTRKLTEEQGILLAARVCAMSIIYSVGG